MNNNKTNDSINGNQAVESEEKWAELIKAVYHNGLVTLKTQFDDVEGQVLNKDNYGPVFTYKVKDEGANVYECGFFLRELVARFQSDNEPAQWMSSFFVELMKTEGGKAFPKAPENEDEAKALFDEVLVPQCIVAVREEFAPEQVHVGLDWNEEHGAVFEAGFPAISDGNNVCAFPLQLLFTYLLLNRDPSDLVIQAMYTIREEHNLV